MKFISKNRMLFNIIITISCIVDIVIAFFINIFSQNPFNMWRWENILSLTIFAVLILISIICNIITNNSIAGANTRKLQKAFQNGGGYEAVVDEMKACIQTDNVKRFKNLKKMVNMIEK